MTALANFPDVEAAVMDLLTDLGNVGVETDGNLQDEMPFIRVAKFGGTDDLITDRPRVDIDVFTATRSASIQLAETVRQRLISGPNKVAAAVIDKAVTVSGPFEVPWGDPNIRRFTASYLISVRR